VTTPNTRNASGDGATGAVPAARTLEERLDDPDEPVYTVAVAAELLGTDSQTLRRVQHAVARASARPSGNQRRYSRNDLLAINAGLDLARQGHPPQSVARIIQLQHQMDGLLADRGDAV